MTAQCSQRTAAFQKAAAAQPGAGPYDNHRPIFVRKHSAGQTLESLLQKITPYRESPALMAEHIRQGWLLVDEKRPSLEQRLVAGNIIMVVIPDTVEPPIAPELTVLYEDEYLIVVDKPSPLPVHPCGRYNRHSLVLLARTAWPDITLKPVHRLDANTTGVLVFGKTKLAARRLVEEFTAHRVKKEYLARVHGIPEADHFVVDAPIEHTPSAAGTRLISQDGRAAITEFELIDEHSDGTSLLRIRPKTGRTNQIRLHLQSIGLSIVGDDAYAQSPETARGLTQDTSQLCLHAAQITFQHPTLDEPLTFSAPPPSYFTPPTE